MPRYKLTIEYDGTGYSGWQRQKDVITVQGKIEEAIKAFSGEETVLFVAGRTDAGVHALGQVAHFDLEKDSTAWRVSEAINFHLYGEKIIILHCEVVDEMFHARFQARQRAYSYKILQRYARPMIDYDRVWHVKQKLDFEIMQKAAKLLIGHHDFSSFRASGCQAATSEITLDEIELVRVEDYIIFNIKARSFLYHMVRNIVGSLVEVGKGKMSLDEFYRIFQAKNRELAGSTAPACGLYFIEVKY